ncbi:MAG: MaoC family dehydratase [Dehalococcoidales bacterium]|nr:MaoC family dehydratase [Dehalococcoidales bacterium]
MNMAELKAGTKLTELKRLVKQEQINAYASASGDFNPIHIDPEFAAKTQLGGTIAHGMLVLAWLSEFMTENFGEDWINTGTLSARFKEAARPGDTITVNGEVTRVEQQDNGVTVECSVTCGNQKDEPVITCITKVKGKQE